MKRLKFLRTVCLIVLIASCVALLFGCQEPACSSLNGDHDLELVEGTDATCTTEGIKSYWRCGHEYTGLFGIQTAHGCLKKFYDENAEMPVEDDKDLVIPALGHTEGEGTVDVQPTCLKQGEMAFYCTVCNEKLRTEPIPVTEHTPIVKQQVNPTCTQTGTTAYTCCKNCETLLGEAPTTLPALGHIVDETTVQWKWELVFATVSFKCSRTDCDEQLSYSADVQVTQTTEPTCTKTGSKTLLATYKFGDTVLSDEKIFSVDMIAHTPVVDNGCAATCTESGLSQGSHCNVCGTVLTQQTTLAPLGHSPVTDVRVEPTCTENGLTEGSHCSVCSAVLTAQQSIAALGHKPETISAKEPTCTQDGYTIGTRCTTCKTVLSGCNVVPKLGHTPTNVDKLEPTCDTDGHTAGKYCTTCDTFLQGGDVIPLLGHNYTGDVLLCTNGCKSVNPEYIPVSTVTDFDAVRNARDKKYYLTQDINVSGQTWEAIGEFSGILDGNGHKVHNFMLSRTSVNYDYGFITKLNGGTLRGLTLQDFTINVSANGNCSIGALVGQNYGLIENCSIEDCVGTYQMTQTSITVRFGVLVGHNQTTIKNCNVNASIDVKSNFYTSDSGHFYENINAGVAIGHNAGNVENCSAQGNICASTWREVAAWSLDYYIIVGGFIGGQANTGVIKNCNSSVNVSTSCVPGKRAYNYTMTGGFIGYNIGRIESSYTTAKCTVRSNSFHQQQTGGFVGYNEPGSSIDSCYSFATVYAESGNTDLGGFAGNNNGSIRSCFSAGTVNCNTGSGRTGGFCGYNQSSGTLTKNYSTSDVNANCSVNYFVERNDGTLLKNYFLNTSVTMYKGELVAQGNEGNATALAYDKLFSQNFLVGDLGWNESGWVIVVDDCPMLETEFFNGHNFDVTTYAPTCEAAGFTVYICTDCRKVVIYNYVEAQGHDWQTTETTAPTCTIDGATKQVCSRDGCTAKREIDIKSCLGHLQSKTISDEHKPTCTQDGYYNYHCDRCDTDYQGDWLPATGHTEEFVKHIRNATCLEEGTDLVKCTVCQEQYEVTVPLADHTYVNMPAEERVHSVDINGVLTAKDGKTAGRECSVCGHIRIGREVVPAHTWEEIERQNATCAAEGYIKYRCTECDKDGYTGEEAYLTKTLDRLSHIDINKDYRCDVCTAWTYDGLDNEYFMEINSIDDLKEIGIDLAGNYKLMVDLDLSQDDGFKPIGSKTKPFTGFFYGNGHKISGMKYTTADGLVGGLFAYNKGTILDVTIDGYKVTASQSTNGEECTFGAIAAYNRGTIKDCKVIGEMNVVIIMTTVVTNNGQKLQSDNFVIGGISAVNGLGGLVDGCTIEGNVKATFVAYSTVRADRTLDVVLSHFRDIVATEIMHVSFGGVVGRNQATVRNCKVTATTTVNRSAIATLWEAIGQAYSTLQLYAGALIGINTGNVYDCDIKAADYVELSRWNVKAIMEIYLNGNKHILEQLYGAVLTYVNSVFNQVCAGNLYTLRSEVINHTENVTDEIEGVIGENTGTYESITTA